MNAEGVWQIDVGKVGTFAENKELAKQWREEEVIPAIEKGMRVVLNFEGVKVATQSFIHALISSILREKGESVLEQFEFCSCDESVKQVLLTVIEYSLEK